MYMLSDEVLLEAYRKAIKLELENDFIRLLLSEISHRGLDKHLHENTLRFKSKKDSELKGDMAFS